MRTLLLAALLLTLTTPAPADDGTLVVFYHKGWWDVGPKGKTRNMVYIDGEKFAQLDSGHYFSVYLKPGTHIVMWQGKESAMHLEVGEKPIYLESALAGHLMLVPMPQEHALKKLKKFKPLERKWIHNDRVVFDLEPKKNLTAEAP